MYRTRAFTLIELMVTISIIAILATLVILRTTDGRTKARNSVAKDDITTIGKSIEIFKQAESNVSERAIIAANTAALRPVGTPVSQSITWTTPNADWAAIFSGTEVNSDTLPSSYGIQVTKTPGSDITYTYQTTNGIVSNVARARAAGCYVIAANQPGAPGAAKDLAGVALAQVSDSLEDRHTALIYWQTVYENAKTESERERAAGWFAHTQLVYSLELAADQYKKATGRYPDSFEELKNAGYISQLPPVISADRRLVLVPGTGRVQYEEYVDVGD